MPNRPRSDWPRLSGRPGPTRAPDQPQTQTVFRRFFDLIERLERPLPGAGNSKAQTPPRNARKGRS